MTARAFLRALKWRTDHITGYIAADDSGRWSAEWSTLLHRHLVAHGWNEDDIPFSPTDTMWSRDMLRAALWVVTPGAFELVELPDAVQMPQSDRVPPDDGSGNAVLEPECWLLDAPPAPAATPVPALVTNAIPWAGGGGQFGGGGAQSTPTTSTPARVPSSSPAPATTSSSAQRTPWLEIAAAGFLCVGAVGLVVGVRWDR